MSRVLWKARKTARAPRRTVAVRAAVKSPAVKAHASLKLNGYEILSRAVETGIDRGFRRAEKYEEKPSQETFKEHIFRETMNEICEVVLFGDAE